MKRLGGCFCRKVRYAVSGSPDNVGICHCLHCRVLAGAPFAVWAEYPAAQFELTGGTPASLEPRPGAVRQFCADCGSPLTWRLEGRATIDITVATLDDPATLEPQFHLYADRMLPWLKIDDELPRHAAHRPRS